MHTTFIPIRNIGFDRCFLVLLAIVLSMGCQSNHETAAKKADPTMAALDALSSLSDTSAVARRLEVISDSLAGRRPSLAVQIALTHARADLLRRRGLPDSGFSVLLQGMDMALRDGDSLALAGVLLDMCRWKEREGRYLTARSFSERALSLYRRYGSSVNIAAASEAAACQLQNLGDYPGAQALILESLQTHEAAGDTASFPRIYNIIGNIQADLGENVKAMLSYRRSAHLLSQINDSGRLSTALANIGLLYRYSNPDSALYYYETALMLTENPRFRLQRVIGMFNKANLFFDRKQYDKARLIYDTVMAVCQRYQFVDGIPRVLSGYAYIAEASGDNRGWRINLARARGMADSMGQSTLALWLRKEELAAAEKLRDIDSVIVLSKDIRRREDSIAGTEKKALIAELELRYQVAGKEREIGSLRSKLTGRQRVIVLLVLLTLALSALIVLYRRQRRVLIQRNRSYESMIARYQTERDRGPEPGPAIFRAVEHDKGQDQALVHGSMPAGQELESSADDILADYERIITLLSEEKLFTIPRLKVEDVAERIGVTPRRVTAALRAQGEDGFNAFNTLLNRFRIAEATRLMEDPASDILKLDTLAAQCGFNSRQHFHRVFEQVTGVNPGYYRKRFTSGSRQSDAGSEI